MNRRTFLKRGAFTVAGLRAGPFLASPFLSSPAFAAGVLSGSAPDGPLRYSAEDKAIVGRNGKYFDNRPLYFSQTPTFLIAGDRPVLRLVYPPYLAGTLLLALVRNGQGKWLHESDDVTMKFRPDQIEWIAKAGNATVHLQAVPMEGASGFAIRLQVVDALAGDQIVWAYGGVSATKVTGSGATHALISTFDHKECTVAFAPDTCQGNTVGIDGELFTVGASGPDHPPLLLVGRCSSPSQLKQADGSAWSDPVKFAAGGAQALPMIAGVTPVSSNQEIFWAIEVATGAQAEMTDRLRAPQTAFAGGLARSQGIGRQVTVETPDMRFDTAVAVSCAAMDAVWESPVYRHAPMRWRSPYIGWRTLFGSIAYGWHDRVLTQTKHLVAMQIADSKVVTAKPSAKSLLALQDDDSCFQKGNGRLRSGRSGYQSNYDMQSQFFDQAIQDWRYTADPEMEKILRPALELHVEWLKMCFDPDDDGLYESYLNTWPTDAQWYNGGGTAEETAYAYRAHQALLDMARRAGDADAVKRHQARLKKMLDSFMAKMWIPDKGYVGAYREQLAEGRLHEDCWMYSIFVPIDANMLSPTQAASSLYFTEYGLEHFKMPGGGERVITSNWVPTVRTVRNLHSGDQYHLALAYFQTGLVEEGWQVLNGVYIEAMYNSLCPGDVAADGNGIDFGDSSNMFCRAVVEGVFGFRPDYPNDIVVLAPCFPAEWDRASIRTPDVAIQYARAGNEVSFTVELARPTALDIQLPARTRGISAVTVNGQPTPWKLDPGFGYGILCVAVPVGGKVELKATCLDALPSYPGVAMEVTSGTDVELRADDARIVKVLDDQGAFSNVALTDGKATARVAHLAGHHLVLALVETGNAQQWRSFKLNITDPEAQARKKATILDAVPAGAAWSCLSIESVFNGDIRTIFQQQYLSPRPNTCSARLMTNGYGNWLMPLDKSPLPPIDLANVDHMRKMPGRITVPQGVPFQWSSGGKNIAFTSQWDNWPTTVVVPVKRQGKALWFLVCGSTNPMQTRIANAELRMAYADGVVEKLELVPPLNFWNLCAIDRQDYDYPRLAFCLPKTPPPTVQLGAHCRAMLLNWRLRPGVVLDSVTLAALSEEVVIGLMGVTVMNAA